MFNNRTIITTFAILQQRFMIRNIFILLVVVGFYGCASINPSIMFKTPKDYKFANPPNLVQIDYKIAPYDIIEFQIFTNDGYKLIDLLSTGASGSGSSTNLLVSAQYVVDKDGFVKLPVLGNVLIKDITRIEGQKMLEEKYSAYYNLPFVKLKVVNKRVFVFNGSGGQGQVVPLANENTTLIEALASVGGLANTGKAKKIKLIRGDLKNPEIQLIDLSTVEGMTKANLMVQANDIIYVEPVRRINQEVLNQISPIIGLLSSLLLIYGLVIRN